MVKYRFKALIKFLKFHITADNLHQLHSPFMFDFARFCLYNRTNFSDYEILKRYQYQLNQLEELITVKDLGAGSKTFTSTQRRIKDIAHIAGSSYTDMKRLYRISRYFKPKNILELGTSLGKATLAMSLGQPQAKMTTVEGDHAILKIAKQQLNNQPVGQIKFISDDFETFLNILNQTQEKFDLIYLDGHHSYKPTIQYFNKLLPHIHNDTVLIIDDIYWSNEMQEAWAYLKKHPAVYQSVDTYYFGLLLFRKEQFRQHFKINLLSLNLF